MAPLLMSALLAGTPSAALGAGSDSRATGGGSFLFAGSIPMQFGFSAVRHADGSASGSFHHAYEFGGFKYQLWGTVTCVTFDPGNGRAWIGGVLTNVASTDPEPGVAAGDDAWFRVLDGAEGDRSTAMGFVGDIPSSAAYCEGQPWPDENARTHPVTEGQIKVAAS
jgi:hypothetical protein